jgi:hypothetical protein
MVTLLRVAALVEVVSLAVLLGNLVTAHLDVVAGIVGPLHGAAYVSVIATTLLLPVRSAVRVRALLPGIGGLLALRALRTEPAPTDPRGGSSGS